MISPVDHKAGRRFHNSSRSSGVLIVRVNDADLSVVQSHHYINEGSMKLSTMSLHYITLH